VDAIGNEYFYCGSNNTCDAMKAENEGCDFTKQNCRPGLHCVTNGGNEGNCTKYATAGQECSTTGDGKPMCSFGLECMWDTKKCEALQSRTSKQACQKGDHCVAGFACDIPPGQTDGTCEAEGTVNCTNSFAEKCKSQAFRGYCKCSSHDEEGTCASDLKDINYCSTEKNALLSCVSAKCDYSGRGYPNLFPADNCVVSQCANEAKSYVCCAKASVVFPPDVAEMDCTPPAQPSPSIQPETSRDSGASAVVVSTIIVAASVIAALV
jgi:hypothetical protein